MSINISGNYLYQLESNDLLKNTAKNILTKGGATSEATQKIIEKTVLEGDKQLREI